MNLPLRIATRYVTPLREGGSLPAIVEADDGGLYVMKFVGAGQGAKALVAEVIAGAIAVALGLDIPQMVLMELDPDLGRNEPDPEIRDLLRSSAGTNLGFRFLPGAFAYNPLLKEPVAPDLASRIVWFDAYTTNVDRTPRNVNLLLARKKLWLIDHGAALYFHHTWEDALARSRTPFPHVKEHVLLPFAAQIGAADAALRPLLSDALLDEIVTLVPDAWLQYESRFDSLAAQRAAYHEFLVSRRDAADLFVQEAEDARARLA